MKKFFYFFILPCIFLGFSFTTPGTNASEKVLDVFNKTFEKVQNVEWINVEDKYTAVFTENDIRTVITYNKNGDFICSRRYYSEENLPFNILLKIKEKYKAKKIAIVTELTQGNNLIYSINVEDDENVYVLETKGTNRPIHLKMKFHKQQFPEI